LKNLLGIRESSSTLENKEKWLTLIDSSSRSKIKSLCLTALRSSCADAAHAAAQVVAKLGSIELPTKEWPELLDDLVKNVSITDVAEFDLTKIATLEALGYLCDDLDEDSLESEDTNKILTAVVDGLRDDRAEDVRLAAGRALLNSLVFTRHNFDVEDERNMIMQVVCRATKSADERMRVVAFESLARIASLYYDKLLQYMNVLFGLTLEAIQNTSENEQVVMMAIEFWSTLCEEEMELIDESLQQKPKGDMDGQPRRNCLHYVQQASFHIVGALLHSALTRQDESADFETWNVAAAGAVSLSLIAQTIRNDVVAPVLQFIEKNILSPEWRNREASIMAFGQILDGPEAKIVAGPIEKALPVLIRALRDESTQVKDSAAWTLGRVCEFHAMSIPAGCLPSLVESLLAALRDTPRVAAQACFAVHNLAMVCNHASMSANPSRNLNTSCLQPATNALSPFFQSMITQLFDASDRPHWQEHNLRGQAYEAINMLIQNHAQDVRQVAIEVLRHVLHRLHSSFTIQVVSHDDKEGRDQLQGLLCSVVQVVIRVIDSKEVATFADDIVILLLQVLQNNNAVAAEESLIALGALAASLELGFEKYMRDTSQLLVRSLRNYSDWQVCNAAVGTTGDLCRALDNCILPFCDELIQCLLESLQNPELNRQVKPSVLSCFGDVALAIGGNFEKYLCATLQMLEQAGLTTVPEDDEELVEYLTVLQESVLEAYTGIVQGLKEGGKTAVLMGSSAQTHGSFLPKVFSFLDLIARSVDERKVDHGVVKHAVGLIGDLADITPRGPASELFKSPCVVFLMRTVRDTQIYKYTKSKVDEHL